MTESELHARRIYGAHYAELPDGPFPLVHMFDAR